VGDVVELRDYQQRAIDMVWDYIRTTEAGNPCLVLPTGAGKSHVIAALCKHAVTTWPGTRIIMTTHVKEIIQQNADKMIGVWPNAPLGVYSASIGSRDLTQPITFCSIQSIRDHADEVGHVDLMIVDEAHLVSHKEKGGYRTLITQLRAHNENMRVIGLTATPYRLGHGLISEQPAVFDALLEPVGIPELIRRGFLAPLRSKHTPMIFDTKGVKVVRGDFVTADLERAIDTEENALSVADTIAKRGADRKHWLVFAAGLKHAESLRRAIETTGHSAEVLDGNMKPAERDAKIERFRSGETRCLVNVNILSTGFDFPGIDLIGFCRPTKSLSLYIQQSGRGMRPAEGKKDCIVLDFAGNVHRMGTIVDPNVSTQIAPQMVCGNEAIGCSEIFGANAPECPACGWKVPPPLPTVRDPAKPPTPKKDPEDLVLHYDDIMGGRQDYTVTLEVTRWRWREDVSKTSGIPMLTCSFYGAALNTQPVTEYFTINHAGYSGRTAIEAVKDYARRSGATGATIAELNAAQPPSRIIYEKEGSYVSVKSARWDKVLQPVLPSA